MSVQEASQGTLQIAGESPLSADVAEMFALSDAYAAALYPAESNHMVEAEALMQPHVIFCVARRDGKALGCGASVLYVDTAGGQYAEIKRMFVHDEARGLGLGARILQHLEAETASRGVRLVRLETGVHSYSARRLYEKCGYRQIPPFGDYWDDPLSLFYEKML
jgi:putative acetyltransferase